MISAAQALDFSNFEDPIQDLIIKAALKGHISVLVDCWALSVFKIKELEEKGYSINSFYYYNKTKISWY